MRSLSELLSKLSLFRLDGNERNFIAHNRAHWKPALPGTKPEILVDLYSVPETLIAYSYFTNALAEIHGARILSFAKAPRYPFHKFHRIYQSFGCTGHVNTGRRHDFREKAAALTAKIWPTIDNKTEMLNLRLLGYDVGVDLYESYLRYYNAPTLELADPRVKALLETTAELVLFWEHYFETHDVRAIVLSHDTYVDLNVPAKIAFKRGIPAYLPNARNIHRVKEPFAVAAPFPKYHDIFQSLPSAEQQEGIAFGERQLESRLSGKVGVDMSYSTKSAYHQQFSSEPLLEKTDRFKVLICSHCFFDNPHCYGKILFEDFYEWLCFLGRIAERTSYDWYVKMHPDPLPGTEEVLRGILAKYPRIKLLPFTASHHQLVHEGINFVLTAYGSVGHEYPIMGVPIMNAGPNPHMAYDFNWHPRSVEEYESWLLRLPTLKKEIRKSDVFEFYFVHYDYCFADGLLFLSHREMQERMKGKPLTEAYRFFLEECTEKRHRDIYTRMKDFIKSGKPFYFKEGPSAAGSASPQ